MFAEASVATKTGEDRHGGRSSPKRE